MQAIVDAIGRGKLRARVGIVLSDNPEAYILHRAESQGIRTGVIDCSPHRSKFPEEVQEATAETLRRAGVDLICLAGFMRVVREPLLEKFHRRILNIHPSLLPAFPGVAAWKQAVEAGVPETGVTVHLVDAGVDTGPIVAQEVVPIMPYDDAETLHARIQIVEHQLYPEAIGIYASTMDL